MIPRQKQKFKRLDDEDENEKIVDNFVPKSTTTTTTAAVFDLDQGQKVEESELEVYKEFVKTMDLVEQFRAFKIARAGKTNQPIQIQVESHNDDDMSENQSSSQDNNDGQQLAKRVAIFKEGEESSKKQKIQVEAIEVDSNPTAAPDKDDMVEADLENGQHGDQDIDDDINYLFLQHTVVKVMMSQMSIEDLKKARAVSSIWNQAASAQLHKLAPLLREQYFEDEDQIQEFTNLMRNSPTRKFVAYSHEVYLAHISLNGFFEFLQVFEPKDLTINFEELYMNELIDIFQNCEKFVKILHIVGMINIGGEICWPGNLKFSQLEKLELLIVNNKILPLPQFIQDDKYIFENLIKASPKLKKLELDIGSSKKYLEILRHSGSGILQNLQELDFSVTAFASTAHLLPNIPETLVQMSCIGLRLRKFVLAFIVVNDNFADLHIQQICSFFHKMSQFLACQSDTLESLKIDIRYLGIGASYIQAMTTIDKFKIPRMPQLKVLGLRNTCKEVSPASTFDQMNLPWCFPKLHEMNLDLTSVSDWEKFFYGASESVERLLIYTHKVNVDAEYQNLEKYFPHVKCLSVENREGGLGLCRKFFADFPWATTLTHLILELSESDLNDLQMAFISYLLELRKLELHTQDFLNDTLNEDPNINLDLESLSNVTYLKIKNLKISSTLENQIREKYVLDYSPPSTHPM